LNYEEVLAYYSRLHVKSEISAYCRSRWAALEGLEQKNERLFLRYWRRGTRPLTINTSEDLDEAFKRFRILRPRTVYASINLYHRLEVAADAENPSNIIKSTPIWDVDASLDSWEYALKAAEIIVSHMEKEGLDRSVYLKWSGRGIHLHIHEEAFSQKLLDKHNPLDVAFSVVEYVLRRGRNGLINLAAKAPQSADRPLRIENKIDLKRVFTAPLSLHRSLDLCCVCFKPNNLYDFNREWARPESYHHDESWKAYEEGEGDRLAEKALAEVGGCDGWSGAPKIKLERTALQAETATTEAVTKMVSHRELGRFQVMGLLQAARYYLVAGNLERAKSFGLNRAVFYAWAKRYSRDKLIQPREGTGAFAKHVDDRKIEQIGDEAAYVSPKGWFIIGNVEQKPSDYDRQIAKRVETNAIPYDDAWITAIEYLKGFPRTTLLDQQRFYKEIYSPVRDTFHILMMRRRKAGQQKTLDRLFGQKSI